LELQLTVPSFQLLLSVPVNGTQTRVSVRITYTIGSGTGTYRVLLIAVIVQTYPTLSRLYFAFMMHFFLVVILSRSFHIIMQMRFGLLPSNPNNVLMPERPSPNRQREVRAPRAPRAPRRMPKRLKSVLRLEESVSHCVTLQILTMIASWIFAT